MKHLKSRTNRSVYGILAVVLLHAVAKHLKFDLTEYGLDVDTIATMLEGGFGAAAIYFRTNARTDIKGDKP